MKEKTLLSSSASSATGAWVVFNPDVSPEALVIVSVASAGTVTVQGKFTSDAAIVNLHAASTASEGYVVQTFPLMRAISSGVSGGAVTVIVGELRK